MCTTPWLFDGIGTDLQLNLKPKEKEHAMLHVETQVGNTRLYIRTATRSCSKNSKKTDKKVIVLGPNGSKCACDNFCWNLTALP